MTVKTTSESVGAGRSQFWSGYARVYDAIWDAPIATEVSRACTISLNGAREVIDLGCGTGLAAQTVVQRARVLGVDASSMMLQRAVSRGRVTQTMVSDAAKTELPSGAADGVICANLLHVHESPATVFEEAARLLKAGGRLVIVTPVERLQHRQMRRLDRASGRSLFASLRADVLRRLVAEHAAQSGVHPWRWAQLHAMFRSHATGLGLVARDEVQTIASQTLLVFEKRSSIA